MTSAGATFGPNDDGVPVLWGVADPLQSGGNKGVCENSMEETRITDAPCDLRDACAVGIGFVLRSARMLQSIQQQQQHDRSNSSNSSNGSNNNSNNQQQPTTNNRQPTTDNRQPTTNKQQTTNT